MRRQGLVLSQRLKAYCDPCSWISNETLARDVVGVWSSRGWRGSETNRETLDSTVAEGAFHRCALIDRTGILLILPAFIQTSLLKVTSSCLGSRLLLVLFRVCMWERERCRQAKERHLGLRGEQKSHARGLFVKLSPRRMSQNQSDKGTQHPYSLCMFNLNLYLRPN